jgi:hypothetical protein
MSQEIVEASPQTAALPAQTRETSIMNVIAALAQDKDADIQKFERLIALKKELDAEQSKRAFDEDFARMKPELPRVIATHHNDQTNSNFAKIEDINGQIDPILGQHGFGTSAKVVRQTPTDVTMRLELKHSGGHAESMELTMPIDDKGAKGTVNKTAIQGIASTITYIKRVGFCALLNISTGDDIDGNNPGSVVTIEQAALIDALIRETGADRARFLAYASAPDVRQIPAANYSRVVTMLQAKKAKLAAEGKQQRAEAAGGVQ